MIKPMLARDEPNATNDPKYLWERKYDGIRIVVRVSGGKFSLQSRSGKDKTKLFPELVISTKCECVLDGEIIASGGSDEFNNVQHRTSPDSYKIKIAAEKYPASFEAFDCLDVKDINIEKEPLLKRKEFLNAILRPTDTAHIAPVIDGDGVAAFNLAKEQGWEGVIGKLKTGPYVQNSRGWIKVKTWQFGDFIVVGFTEGTGWRASSFGALVLADMNGNYVGSVGTGFDQKDIDRITATLYSSPKVPCPFPREPEKATWIKPSLTVEIRFLELTNDGRLRFPSYKGEVA